MAEKTDRTLDAYRFGREQKRRVTAATAIGLNALKPVVHFQVSMLRLWAKNIERLADNYENGVEKTASSAGEEHSEQERAVTLIPESRQSYLARNHLAGVDS